MANAVDFNERMQEHIENLVKLQAVELERTRLAQVARALPAEIAEAQAALTAAERLAAEASAALSREESLRSRLDREIGAHRQKAARYRAQQDSLTTPAQANAVEHELHFAEAEAERLENEEFASLERTEAQEAALAAARAKVESLAAALDNTRERISLRRPKSPASRPPSPPSAKPSGRLSRPSGSCALIDSAPPAALVSPALKISNAPVAAWASGPRCGTSFAKASCSPATVATACSTGTRRWPPLQRNSRTPSPNAKPRSLRRQRTRSLTA